jgi:hypothetical protein
MRQIVTVSCSRVLRKNFVHGPAIVDACTALDRLFQKYLGLEPDEARMRAREILPSRASFSN